MAAYANIYGGFWHVEGYVDMWQNRRTREDMPSSMGWQMLADARV